MLMFLIGALVAWTIMSIIIIFYLDPDPDEKEHEFIIICIATLPVATILFILSPIIRYYHKKKREKENKRD